VSGFWHGANWTFIAWGGIHAALFLPLLLRGTNRRYTSDTIGEGRWLPTGREFLGMAWTFTMVCIAWVFFRAESVGEAVGYLQRMITFAGTSSWSASALTVIAMAILVELVQAQRQIKWPRWVIWSLHSLAAVLILLESQGPPADFIYFQF